MDHQVVSLKQVKYNDMKNILDFMYYGEIDVLSNEVPSLMETAKVLEISLLARDSVKIEKQEKQDDLTSSAAAHVEDIIEEYPYNSEFTNKEGNVKLENKFPTECFIKMESENELVVSEFNSVSTENMCVTKSLEIISGSTIHPEKSGTRDSSDGQSLYVSEEVREDPERNVIQIYQNKAFDEALINVHNKDQCVATTEHLEIQFESICDASEASFCQKGSLKEHLRTLTVKKPSSWSFCKAFSSINGYLKTYMQTRTV